MPDTIIFDSLGFVKRGVDAGASPQLAEWLAREQAQLLESNLATKADIERCKNDRIKWFTNTLLVFAGIILAGVAALLRIFLN